TFVVPPPSRESREADGEPRSGTERTPCARMDRTHRDLCASHFEDGVGFKPDVGLELRVDPCGPAVPSHCLEFLGEGEQSLVIESGAQLACGPEDVGFVIVCRHEQRSVGTRALPSACECADDDEVDRVAQCGAVLFLELDPLESARTRVVRRVERLRHETLASGLEGFVEKRLRLLHILCYP